ncbi:DUF4197 domain-containing protein [Hymenobacter busanensis]|uniref:DUF4197 domain-containing protein n=1 Tax=Hymenobacter busanensis TaxID=2607656 RepID=A0A7L4ZWJ3_9BACT|nr:DUF4197 domain-containing protein [Hymenobacter busanensis]KAA9339673.1 DUF4197 domain-containing protein [Hymenobacter busanensis]QHJ06572.1 DUF4197 family protein [Hymenobacter busanensis]
MNSFRVTLLALALGLTTASAASAQTKTTAKKTTTTTKKTTTTAKKPAAKTTAKTTTTKTTVKPATPVTPPAPVVQPLTADEATAAVREALNLSVTRAVEAGGQPDAFNTNPDIRLGFPPEAELVSTTLRGLKMGAVVDKFEVQMNRAAEAVAPQAATILAGAVQRLTIADALALVNTRESRVAAQLLKQQAQAQVQQELRPLMDAALEQTGAKQAYGELMLRYKKIPLVTPITTNLTDYATQKTAEGLFTLIADEESRIRLNSSARTTATLKRAFGSN